MDFKKKNFKYKSKYLKLKKLEQLGGEITEIPDNFSIGLKSELKPGYHINAIFDKGDKYYIDGKEFEHEGSLNMDAFVKTIKDKKGKEWVIYDHNLDPELDVHLINSF